MSLMRRDLNWFRHADHLRQFGDTKGEKLLMKVLKLKKINGDNTPVVLPKNIQIVSDQDGSYIMPLTEEVLRPNADSFIIDDNYSPGYFSVDIDFKKKPVKDQPLDRNKDLKGPFLI